MSATALTAAAVRHVSRSDARGFPQLGHSSPRSGANGAQRLPAQRTMNAASPRTPRLCPSRGDASTPSTRTATRAMVRCFALDVDPIAAAGYLADPGGCQEISALLVPPEAPHSA